MLLCLVEVQPEQRCFFFLFSTWRKQAWLQHYWRDVRRTKRSRTVVWDCVALSKKTIVWTNASIEHVIKCSDWIVAACKRVTKHSQCMIAWYWTQSLQKAGSVLPRGRTSRVFDTLRKLLLCAALYMVLVANQSGMKETERVDWAQIALYCVCSVGISQKCKLLNLF